MFRSPFTLEQTRTFLAVAARQHVTRAAEDIHLSQGAVTQQIQLFERALGLALFERVGRSVRLTDAGKQMVPACRALIRAAESVLESAGVLLSVEAGSVHVGASQTAASHYLPAVLASFLKLHPAVQVRVASGNTAGVWRDVAAGVLDCGLVEGEPISDDLVSAIVAEDELILVASPDHPIAHRRRVRLEQLQGALYLAREPGSGTEALVSARLGPLYGRLKRVELGQLDAVKAAARAGVGVAALPRIAIESELAQGSLVSIGVAPWKRRIRAIRRPAPGGPALESFWSLLSGTNRSG